MARKLFFHKIIATGLGTGYAPIAPGTAGSVFAVFVWWVLSCFLSPPVLFWTTLLLILVFTVAGAWSAGKMEAVWGEDPSRVVVDEMVGVWIALLPLIVNNLCFQHPAPSFYYIPAALVLFRLFDIFKPLGIRKMENIPGGWGIMLDDILAGVYSFLILGIAGWIIG